MLRVLFLSVIAIGLTYLFWPYNVYQLRTTNPTTTSLMELRKTEARQANKPLSIQYSWRSFNQISPALVHAVLLSEDDLFYEHSGFDLEQIKIAYHMDMEKKRFAYGGSTITQQLARTLFLRPRKSIIRKAKEAVLTVYLEKLLSKRRIFEIYLNVVEWGPGIFGAEAAAQHYFSKPASELTPDEGVALASILPSPRKWSPTSERAFMARRRTQLLQRMRREGYAPMPENPSPTDNFQSLDPTWDPMHVSEPPWNPEQLSEPDEPVIDSDSIHPDPLAVQ